MPINTSSFRSQHTKCVHAVVVAAGKGSRFGSSLAKQHVTIGQKTVLQHSIAALSSSRHIHSVTIVIASNDQWAKTTDFNLPVDFVHGGETRWQSVRAGVMACKQAGAQHDDLVLIHDAARPCVDADDIDKVICAAYEEEYGAILATPCVDTLKYAESKASLKDTKTEVSSLQHKKLVIQKTLDRSSIFKAQTPQVYRLNMLLDVLNHIEREQLQVTDEAGAFEHLALPIRLVQGKSTNIKLTHAEDMLLIEALLKQKQTHSM